MSGNLIEFMKLYQGTSAASGKAYFRGRMNGLRLVGFMVEAKEGEDAHLQLYVDGGGDRQGNGASKTARQQNGNASSYRGTNQRRDAAPRSGSGGNPPAPFNDAMPFGGDEWTP